MRRTIFIIFLLLISTFSFTFSQVVIKEKVELKPSAKIITYDPPDYTPCGPLKVSTDYFNPWQVVWNGSTFALDPMQQLFNQQGRYYSNYGFNSNSIYNIAITKGQEYCHIIDIINGDTLGSTLSNVPGNDLIGTGQWSKNWCDLWETDSLPRYLINFDRDTPQETEVVITVKSNTEETAINYHTLVETPLMQFSTSFAPTIKHYDSTRVDLIANPFSCPASCWGYLPSSIKYMVEIISGEQYGRLFNSETGQSGNSFSNVETDGRDTYGFYFVADGVQPDSSSPGIVKINFIPSDPDLGIQEAVINVQYNTIKPGIVISMDKTNIDPGDTVQINLKYRNEDGSISDFPYWTKFEVGIIEGCEGGKLLAEGDTGAYFYNVSQPIKFIAVDGIQGDKLSIKLRAAPVEGGIIASKIASADSGKKLGIVNKIEQTGENNNLIYSKLNAIKSNNNSVTNIKTQTNSKLKQTQSSYCFGGEFQNPNSEDTTIQVADYKILLGETKYFGLRKKAQNDSLNIVEIKTDYGKMPVFPNAGVGWDWIKDNSIWGSNPVSVCTGKNYGKRMGGYWETKKPVWNGNSKVGDLADGLIRLVGRYWTTDSTYKVNLIAKKDKDSVSIVIKVVKPGKLLTEGQSPTYSKSRDVFDKEYNVDSLCIYWGGLYGIPPQLLKGHIEKEAPTKDFPCYTGFAPAYRYEPFTTQFWGEINNLINNNNPFVVTKNAMGISGAAKVPTETEHYNVLLIHYPESPKTVWEFIDENSQLTNPDNPSTFGYRYKGSPPDQMKKGQMHSSSYSVINNNYNAYLDTAVSSIKDKYKLYDDNKKLSIEQQIEANDSARVQLVKYLRYEWKGNLDSIAAQTRIAASYGLLQNLYTTALGEGFKDTPTNNPEKLNEPDGFKYNIYHYASLFNKNSFSLKKTNNFVSSYTYYNSKTKRLIFEARPGFEEAFRTVVFNWNKSSGYNQKVFEYMKNFLPRK